jgi:hypothetical protein
VPSACRKKMWVSIKRHVKYAAAIDCLAFSPDALPDKRQMNRRVRLYITSQQINWLKLWRGWQEIFSLYLFFFFGKQIMQHVHWIVTHSHNWVSFASFVGESRTTDDSSRFWASFVMEKNRDRSLFLCHLHTQTLRHFCIIEWRRKHYVNSSSSNFSFPLSSNCWMFALCGILT